MKKFLLKQCCTGSGLALALMLSTASAHADPIQWSEFEGGNGHWYEVVEDELSWFQASDLAAASGGHLVSITSSGENVMLCNAGLPDTAGRPYWTCGVRQGGAWSWENGDAWGYTNWDGSEPNGCCGYGGYGANYLVWRPWNNVASCGWDDSNPFHCSDDPGCTPRTLIEYSADCNGDGIVDYGQILDGTYEDADGNGVPDCCDEGEPCDLDGELQLINVAQWTTGSGGNGHWYGIVDHGSLHGVSAEEHFLIAESFGGHTATMGSAAENQFCYERHGGESAMIGVRKVSGTNQGAWVTGEPWQYSNWHGGEGNNSWERYAVHWAQDGNPSSQWQDTDLSPKRYSIIEWEADCNGDGIVDYGQILDGTYEDADGNGVPDCCDEGEPCDSVPPGSNHVLELNNWPDAAVIPHHPSVTPSDAMTIEFWIKVEGGNSNSRPITKRPGNGGCYTVSAYTTAEGCQAGVDVFGDCNGASWGDIGCEWVHLAQTVDGSTGISRGYINGELVSILDQGGPCGIGQGSWDLRFGNTNGFSSTQFIGRLDNIRIWNSVLEEDEIRHWMGTDITSAIAATLPELGGSWNFEDGVTDATGVNDGWLEGSAVLVEDEAIYLDCNGNAVADSQDIADGTSTDFNDNQIPDDCECLADVDGDEQVAVNDVLLVIAQWGQPGPLADVDLDGTVGVNDVLMVLNGWGACP